MELGKNNRRCAYNYKMENEIIIKTTQEKDLGVIFTENLSLEHHINKTVSETLNPLRNIRTSFTYSDKEMMRKIITSMIRPRLEYAAVIWSPHQKKHIRKLERVQRAAMKMTPELQDSPYEERLTRMELTTLEKKRERGDMITLFILLNGMENIDRGDLYELNVRETRGHGKK